MKNSIKIKLNETTKKLLNKPVELATLLTIAFYQDEAIGYAEKAVISPNKKALEDLVTWGLVTDENGKLSLTNKKVVEITLKKKSTKEIDLNVRFLNDVKISDVPEIDQEYFKIATAFQNMFRGNLKAIGARTKNLELAKYGNWVSCARLMVEADGIKTEQLREVWSFLKLHDFWSANVQSILKLRTKFETIYNQIKANETRKSKSNTNVSQQYVERIINDLQSK